MKSKSLSEILCFIGGALSLITLVIYLVYSLIYDYFDYIVVIGLALGVLSAVGYLMIKGKVSEFLNLFGVVVISYSLGIFFLNSFPVWADRLNHIDMYGARGSLVPVVIIMLLLIFAILFTIASCFSRREAE